MMEENISTTLNGSMFKLMIKKGMYTRALKLVSRLINDRNIFDCLHHTQDVLSAL